jgi:predicted DNA-binding transcriptional regulator AlpA
MNIQEKYISEKQVAEITGIALSTLRNGRSRKSGIPYSKLGRSVRYKLQDVLDFVESRKIRTQ